MGGNIPNGNFLGGNFPVGIFLEPDSRSIYTILIIFCMRIWIFLIWIYLLQSGFFASVKPSLRKISWFVSCFYLFQLNEIR